jgi:chemotaxis protein CheX
MWFATEDVQGIVETVWVATLDEKIRPLAELPEPSPETATFTGCVNIVGAWEGQVVLQLPMELVRRSAAKMLTLDANELTLEDMQDTAGELTNMVGGNVKALLPQPSRLSLPSVVEGTDYNLRVPGAVCVSRIVFESEGSPFVVTMHAREDGPAN